MDEQQSALSISQMDKSPLLVVKNFPQTVNNSALKALFSQYGAVRAQVVFRGGKNMGWAGVQFSTDADVAKCLSLSFDLEGTRLKLSLATENDRSWFSKGKKGGSGGGGQIQVKQEFVPVKKEPSSSASSSNYSAAFDKYYPASDSDSDSFFSPRNSNSSSSFPSSASSSWLSSAHNPPAPSTSSASSASSASASSSNFSSFAAPKPVPPPPAAPAAPIIVDLDKYMDKFEAPPRMFGSSSNSNSSSSSSSISISSSSAMIKEEEPSPRGRSGWESERGRSSSFSSSSSRDSSQDSRDRYDDIDRYRSRERESERDSSRDRYRDYSRDRDSSRERERERDFDRDRRDRESERERLEREKTERERERERRQREQRDKEREQEQQQQDRRRSSDASSLSSLTSLSIDKPVPSPSPASAAAPHSYLTPMEISSVSHVSISSSAIGTTTMKISPSTYEALAGPPSFPPPPRSSAAVASPSDVSMTPEDLPTPQQGPPPALSIPSSSEPIPSPSPLSVSSIFSAPVREVWFAASHAGMPTHHTTPPWASKDQTKNANRIMSSSRAVVIFKHLAPTATSLSLTTFITSHKMMTTQTQVIHSSDPQLDESYQHSAVIVFPSAQSAEQCVASIRGKYFEGLPLQASIVSERERPLYAMAVYSKDPHMLETNSQVRVSSSKSAPVPLDFPQFHRDPTLLRRRFIYFIDFEAYMFNEQLVFPCEIGIVRFCPETGINGFYWKLIHPGKIPASQVSAVRYNYEYTHGIPQMNEAEDEIGFETNFGKLWEEICDFMYVDPDCTEPPASLLILAKDPKLENKALNFIVDKAGKSRNCIGQVKDCQQALEGIRHLVKSPPEFQAVDTDFCKHIQVINGLAHRRDLDACSFHRHKNPNFHCALSDAIEAGLSFQKCLAENFSALIGSKAVELSRRAIEKYSHAIVDPVTETFGHVDVTIHDRWGIDDAQDSADGAASSHA